MRIAFILTTGLLLFSTCLAEEPYELDRIIVRSEGSSPEANPAYGNHPVETISSQEISDKKLNALTDLLDSVSGLDLRSRSAFGIQGDLSLRGSNYEQVAVLLDGINVNDPQTGHHNLDIPLTAFDLERVEVLKEGFSSLYGSGASAGSVNMAIKKPSSKGLDISAFFGEHALSAEAFSVSLPSDALSGRLSFDHKLSKAARPNTDFESSTTSFYLVREWQGSKIDSFLGYQKKDFGADSFYSNLFAEEEEHTETFFAKSTLSSQMPAGRLKNSAFFRKHRDKFILERHKTNPANCHSSYIYGLDSQFVLPLRQGELLFGLELKQDEIDSTNLGRHKRPAEAGYLAWKDELFGVSADFSMRLEHCQGWDTQEVFNLGLGRNIIGDKLRINLSLGRSFRIPTFTELYYSDAANKGDPELKIEEVEHLRTGISFKEGPLDLNLDAFLRRSRNLIDWTRPDPASVWTATNLGRVDFRGLEFRLGLRPDIRFKGLECRRAGFSYTYLDAERGSGNFLSKYALDVLRHQFIFNIDYILCGLNFDWQLSYNQRCYGETYFVGDISISKKIIQPGFIVEPFIKIDNFSDSEYREIAGVLMPGRWIKSGVRFSW